MCKKTETKGKNVFGASIENSAMDDLANNLIFDSELKWVLVREAMLNPLIDAEATIKMQGLKHA